MIQTVLAINGEDCTMGDGNSAAELEAIAVTLLRTAEAIRNQEEGMLECISHDGNVLAYAHVHVCGSTCDERTLAEPPTIERFDCLDESPQSLRTVALTMINHYRSASKHT